MSERQYALNMIDKFAKPGAIFAMVADSYDVFKFCEMLGSDPEIKAKIKAHGATGGFVVIRPDSGDPVEVNCRLIEILGKNFGYTVNTKGFKVLNYVRLIQGDGVNEYTVRGILEAFMTAGWSADNVAFGMGGALLGAPQRDDQKWAMKCSAAKINGVWVPVQKDPVTDSGKRSKAGRVTLFRDRDGQYRSGVEDWEQDALQTVFENGRLLIDDSFDAIRARSNQR